MKARKQSTTSYPITFCMVSSTDHIAAVTGITPTVTISKNGGGFASPSGAVTEVGNGWYQLAGNATDRNTLGELLLHATGTGADPWDDRYTVVPFDPFDSAALGLTNLDAAVSTRGTANPGDAMDLITDAVDAAAISADTDTYQAKIWMFDDDAGGNDRYVVAWHMNGQPVFSGITSPQLQVIKAADGTDLIAATAMTQIASTGMYRLDEATNRIAAGAGYIAKATATIDGSTRTWVQPIGRDA